MSSSGLSELRIGLAVVFVFTLLAIFAQLCYILWRRRSFLRRHTSGESDITTTGTTDPFGGTSSPYYYSKELLYFLCWKNQARIEPAFRSSSTNEPNGAPWREESDIDEFKLLEMYGPSRVLFTIKEEEKEDYYNDEKSSSAESKKSEKKRVSLEECFDDQRATGGEVLLDDQPSSMATIVIDGDIEVDERESTPFSTPCASPPYYTPTPSPSRDNQVLQICDDGIPTQIDYGDEELERETPVNMGCSVLV